MPAWQRTPVLRVGRDTGGTLPRFQRRRVPGACLVRAWCVPGEARGAKPPALALVLSPTPRPLRRRSLFQVAPHPCPTTERVAQTA